MGSEPLHLIIDVAWLAGYSAGVDDIDAHHRRLIAMLTRMRTAYAAGQEAVCRALIKQFAVAIQDHFAREEAFFKQLSYPGAERHRAQHAVLARRVEAISQAADCMPMPRRTLADLIDALAVVMMTDHLTLDLELRHFLPWQSGTTGPVAP